MTHEPVTAAGQAIVIEIGGIPIQVRSESPEFLRMLEERYAGFLNGEAHPVFEFDVELVQPRRISEEDDVVVSFDSGRWLIERGDFRAEWEPETRRGKIIQSANPYSIDSVLRIVHTLVLAREGGLLVHAASAVRNGKAFLFAGVSEAGKTTISRLAPSDVTLLTDEISYLRRDGGRDGNGYAAYGTPFAGELARAGENVKAPLAALYLLRKGTENTIEPVRPNDAARMLLENVLFFACDPDLVGMVFDAACELVQHVPVYRLTFFPDARVWELIG
ncbi:hypothetical protein [Granulicella mallensis]|uniref:HPr kinase n=1 Tax=Granulicella mallensis TaxID=940614 RepID=A0A7W7ZUN1_9BACT|nr:hypothetical protein [Granulicella mallensis]MBB5066443.1 hypothetical protein [Granulicella mallensis]